MAFYKHFVRLLRYYNNYLLFSLFSCILRAGVSLAQFIKKGKPAFPPINPGSASSAIGSSDKSAIGKNEDIFSGEMFLLLISYPQK